MLKLKALLAKILKALAGLRVSPTYQSNVGATIFSGTWTAPADGIVVLVGTFNTSGSGAYWYVQDSSDIIGAMCLNSANGYRQSTVIPVYKGGKYKTYASNALTTATGWFYKTNCILGGGIALTQVISRVIHFLGGGYLAEIKSSIIEILNCASEGLWRRGKELEYTTRHRNWLYEWSHRTATERIEWDHSRIQEHWLNHADIYPLFAVSDICKGLYRRNLADLETVITRERGWCYA